MYVRLGFAVAVHVAPEILLIDKTAVGDEAFQRKCLEHLYELRRAGDNRSYRTPAPSRRTVRRSRMARPWPPDASWRSD